VFFGARFDSKGSIQFISLASIAIALSFGLFTRKCQGTNYDSAPLHRSAALMTSNPAKTLNLNFI